ncbi:2042_t:CDS:2, partial [Racocetra fulgida]
SLKFYSLHNLLLVNRSFCSCVVPLLWTDPLEKARSDDDRYKIIDIYLSCLNKEEQIELDKLLIKNIVIKKQKELLFLYVNFLKIYSYYELKHVGVFMWCLKKDILSLKPQVFLLIHKMIVRVCRYIKELNISTNTFDAEWFVNLPRPWFPQSTITSLDISFGFFPYALNESISQLIRKAFQELKEIRVIKASFGNGINEDNAIIFTENDLKNIASLPNLKILKIENSSFKAKDKEIISTCSLTKLQKLKLKNNELVINKFLVSMKCETLKILSITLTNSQIEKND